MKAQIDRVHVWSAEIEDQPGALAEKLQVLSDAGASLEFVVSRRSHEKPGAGVVFATPIAGVKQMRAAKEAGFAKSDSLHSLRFSSGDKAGLGAEVTGLLAEAGINLRGFSGAAIGRKAVFHFAFDSEADAAKAQRLLKKKRS